MDKNNKSFQRCLSKHFVVVKPATDPNPKATSSTTIPSQAASATIPP